MSLKRKNAALALDNGLDRRVPLAIVLALLLQAGGIVWWAATKDSDDRFEQQRVSGLEQALQQTKDNQTQIMERLARIEERVSAGVFMIDRIGKQLEAAGK